MIDFDYDTVTGETIKVEANDTGYWYCYPISKKKLDPYDVSKIQEEIDYQLEIGDESTAEYD